MPVVDMHLNPVARPVDADLDLVTAAGLAEYCRSSTSDLDAAEVTRAVLVVLADRLLDDDNAAAALNGVIGADRFDMAIAVDFRSADAANRLERARALGASALKFHAYRQRIGAADHEQAIKLAKQADALGMFVMVCCSFGTRDLDRYSGLRLAAAIGAAVSCPVVMSHAGGRQVLEAMLVADDLKNVYLETSFSISYYAGSSVEQDFAFAMRKLGTDRWLYGSDAPFVAHAPARRDALAFLERHHFSDLEIENVLHRTAMTFLDRHR